jgi:hypothetical protein
LFGIEYAKKLESDIGHSEHLAILEALSEMNVSKSKQSGLSSLFYGKFDCNEAEFRTWANEHNVSGIDEFLASVIDDSGEAHAMAIPVSIASQTRALLDEILKDGQMKRKDIKQITIERGLDTPNGDKWRAIVKAASDGGYVKAGDSGYWAMPKTVVK